MEDHDAVADSVAMDALACGDDGSGHLMPEDARGGVGAGVDLLEVGAADAAGSDFDEQLAGADARDGDGLDTHVIDATIDNGAHGGRDSALHQAFRI